MSASCSASSSSIVVGSGPRRAARARARLGAARPRLRRRVGERRHAAASASRRLGGVGLGGAGSAALGASHGASSALAASAARPSSARVGASALAACLGGRAARRSGFVGAGSERRLGGLGRGGPSASSARVVARRVVGSGRRRSAAFRGLGGGRTARRASAATCGRLGGASVGGRRLRRRPSCLVSLEARAGGGLVGDGDRCRRLGRASVGGLGGRLGLRLRSRPAALRSILVTPVDRMLPGESTTARAHARAVRSRSGGPSVIGSAVRSFVVDRA